LPPFPSPAPTPPRTRQAHAGPPSRPPKLLHSHCPFRRLPLGPLHAPCGPCLLPRPRRQGQLPLTVAGRLSPPLVAPACAGLRASIRAPSCSGLRFSPLSLPRPRLLPLNRLPALGNPPTPTGPRLPPGRKTSRASLQPFIANSTVPLPPPSPPLPRRIPLPSPGSTAAS